MGWAAFPDDKVTARQRSLIKLIRSRIITVIFIAPDARRFYSAGRRPRFSYVASAASAFHGCRLAADALSAIWLSRGGNRLLFPIE